MNTLQLQQWHKEFDELMSDVMPEQLLLDQLRDLHRRSTEQPDMWREEPEHETERML